MNRLTAVLLILTALWGGGSPLHSENVIPRRQTAVELESLAGNRLWVRQPTGLRLTPEFSVVVSWSDGSRYEVSVADALFNLVATAPIPDSLCRRLNEKSDFTLLAVLDSAKIASNLVIAMPSFISLNSSVWPSDNTELGITYEYRRYDNAQDLEIDRRLGKIDVLIMPETEIDDSAWLALDIPLMIEWYVIVKPRVDELAAVAVNYALRNEFFDSTSERLSAVYVGIAEKLGYPRDLLKAEELFAGMKKSESPTKWEFGYDRICPRTIQKLMTRIDRLANTKSDCRNESNRELYLMPYMIDLSDTSFLHRREDMLKILTSSGMSLLFPGFGLGSDFRSDPDEALLPHLSKLAGSCRLIPLGRTKLAARLSNTTRCLRPKGQSISLTDLYRVKQ